MTLDKIALAGVAIVVLAYLSMILFGLIAVMPWGLIGLVPLCIVLYVIVRVIRDRLGNAEDNYYEKNIHK